jgi:multidrug efflux pump subunit AcrB
MLSANGRLVPLSELVSIQHTEIDRSIDYKNLLPVVYAIGDVPDAYRKRGYFTR